MQVNRDGTQNRSWDVVINHSKKRDRSTLQQSLVTIPARPSTLIVVHFMHHLDAVAHVQ
jgi:hypothetical protein